MDEIEISQTCKRCGDQVRLKVITPRQAPVTNPLSEILDVYIGDRIIILAKCGCSSPRINAIQGAPVYHGDVDNQP